MQTNYHSFHIPVMGTGHSIDTPIRVAHLGISSVISIVDDLLVEKIRSFYCGKFNLAYHEIHRKEPDGRAKRITAYLNVVQQIVDIKVAKLKSLKFFEDNEKSKYFRILPEESPLKQMYNRLLKSKDPVEIEKLSNELTSNIRPGSIDVNIMVKLDKLNQNKAGEMLSEEFSDAKAAFRGYANSILNSSIVFSAGINRSLYGYISQFNDFYRDKTGELKKKIIIKVSDFRSALVQGKFLAMKGLEVSEFRIESGLNCGGHAFASHGYLLPSLLAEFKEKKDQLAKQLKPLILSFYKSSGREYPSSSMEEEPLITVQGGIGTNGEARRMMEYFGCDATGWGSPFLLVPEATCVDVKTLELLKNAKKEDLYLSIASPLGVPFNNLRGSGSERWTSEKADNGKPGSPCPKGFLVSNTEFSEQPICTASMKYQVQKINSIANLTITGEEKESLKANIEKKVCLCEHLGNGALINLGIETKGTSPQAICPGPNIVWFDREYSLEEMIEHIYGKILLTPVERPHMFSQEINLYINYFETLSKTMELNETSLKYLRQFKENLEEGIKFCLKVSEEKPYPGENLESISAAVDGQVTRLNFIAEKIKDLYPEQKKCG